MLTIHCPAVLAPPLLLLLLQDTYAVDQDTASRHVAYYSPNIWPQQHLPQLETAFKQLGALIIRVGLSLAGHCSK